MRKAYWFAGALLLVLAACSGDDDTADPATSPSVEEPAESTIDGLTTTAPVASTGAPGSTEASGSTATSTPSTEGCGSDAWTDPTDWSHDRALARCSPGFPEPQPLAERTKIVVSTNPTEFTTPIWVGMEMGEFEKENLEIEFQPVGGADAFTQLVAGNVQVVSFSPSPAFINGAIDGNGTKWVLGSHVSAGMGDASVPQGGALWARRDAFSDPDNPDLAELAGETLVTTVAGPGSITTTWLGPLFEEAGLEFGTDVTLQGMETSDAFTALETGAFKAAYLVDPFWRQAAAELDKYVQLAVGERIAYSGWFFGEDLLTERPEVGDAFARAFIRTINTYLADNYYENPEVVAILADRLGVAPDTFQGDSLQFTWEVPAGLEDRMQEWAVKLGLQTHDPVPEDQLIDRSFYERAVGYNAG